MTIDMENMVAYVNGALDKYLPVKDNFQKNIYEAMRYSLLASGKRIRPILAFAAAEILDVPREEIKPFACAIEMIHTYSLIHDDLPAMDNDDLRRGRPTCHKQFNEALAILAGDGLLNKAFEIMSQNIKDMNGVLAMNKIAEMSGSEGMIGGQVVDLESEGHSVSGEILQHMYRCKTGALLKAPILAAVALSCGNKLTDEAKYLIHYGEIIGVAFQVKDDILDVEGNTEVLGKAVGRDVKEKKSTMVTLYGMEYCKQLLERLTAEAIADCEYFGNKGDFLKELAIYLLKRDK